MILIKCYEEIYLKFNHVAAVLGDKVKLTFDNGGMPKIVNPHLSPLLIYVVQNYFKNDPVVLFSIDKRNGDIAIMGSKARRVAAQYVYTVFKCVMQFEKSKICKEFEEVFDVPESKLSSLNESDTLIAFIESVERRERELNELAQQLAAAHGTRYENFSAAYEAAKEVTKGINYVNECERRVLTSMVARNLVERKQNITKDKIKEGVLRGDYTVLPPCMATILKKIMNGENISHFERFTIATYLLNHLNLDIDHVMQIFSHLPDFNEKITRYQLQHIAGMRGSKKKYMVPSCARLKVEGICNENCSGIRNPVQYGK